MTFLAERCTRCGNLIQVRWRRSRPHRMARRPDYNPFRAVISDKPDRRINGWIALPRHEFAAETDKMILDDLDCEILEFPVRHLDVFPSDETSGIHKPAAHSINEPPAWH